MAANAAANAVYILKNSGNASFMVSSIIRKQIILME
jgi:hypothetical protein